MDDIVYIWPKNGAIPPKKTNGGKNCYTCAHAIITILGECTMTSNGEYVHQDGYCPAAWTCKYWKQASKAEIEMNGIDWSKATKIIVD